MLIWKDRLALYFYSQLFLWWKSLVNIKRKNPQFPHMNRTLGAIDEMAGWHHQLDGHEFGWTPGVGDGQGGLACCDSWGHKESDKNEWLNWTELRCHWLWKHIKKKRNYESRNHIFKWTWVDYWWLPDFLVMVKNLPAKQETRAQSLGREDPLEKG